MLTLNVTNHIIMKITVWLIPTRQRFDNCLLKKFNYTWISVLIFKYLPKHNVCFVKCILGCIFTQLDSPSYVNNPVCKSKIRLHLQKGKQKNTYLKKYRR
jgi:hypothetical protein